ncbi:MAG: heme o synthase [Gammaproteobacteria bacterium]|nr:heme o synthase [Gammaproteobacteria bacterium]
MASEIAAAGARPHTWWHYFELTKPKVVSLIVFTALVGILLAIGDGPVPWQQAAAGLAGIAAAAAAGAVFNHAAEGRTDAVMERTRGRPLPSGRVEAPQALAFGGMLVLVSMALLVGFTNLLTALLTLASMVGYAVIYTVYLKRHTPQNVVWGGAAGAAPPLLGWCAITGSIEAEPLLLFLIIFTWTPPHFWALAIRRREDYARAGLPMLPVTHGVAFTKQQILIYTIMLLAVSLLPFALGLHGLVYLAGAVLLGAGFLRHAWRLWRSEGDAHAMPTFRYSILYLTVLFVLLLADAWLPTWHG